MKTAIVYYSKHHGNTKKVLDYISAHTPVTLIDVSTVKTADLFQYDLIGFASGIYYSKFHSSVLQFAQNNLPANKKVFFVYTYGAEKSGYTKAIASTVAKKSASIAGEFGCLGFNTFGPFKLIGGIAKHHPTQTDLDNALAFFNTL